MFSIFSTKTLLAAGFALALALAVAVSFGGRSAPRESEVSAPRVNDARRDEAFPTNAFLPGRGENTSAFSEPKESHDNSSVVSGGTSSVLSQLQTLVPQFISPKTEEKEIAKLPLPEVTDEEIIVSPDGIGTTLEYLVYFATRSKNAKRLDWEKIKDYLSLRDLVERALDAHDLGSIRAPLLAHRELLSEMIDSLKTVKVKKEVVELHKNVIRYDRLAIVLIDKALGVADGNITESAFRDFYAGYVSSTLAAHYEFVADSGLLASGSQDTFFARLMRWFGLGGAAFAQTPSVPFGGKLICTTIWPLPPLIPEGYLLTVGPPVPIVTSFLFEFMYDPLFFPFKSPFHGAWVLGLSTPEPFATVIMIGTSVPDPTYIPPIIFPPCI